MAETRRKFDQDFRECAVRLRFLVAGPGSNLGRLSSAILQRDGRNHGLSAADLRGYAPSGPAAGLLFRRGYAVVRSAGFAWQG